MVLGLLVLVVVVLFMSDGVLLPYSRRRPEKRRPKQSPQQHPKNGVKR